jgi:hypothetical protein
MLKHENRLIESMQEIVPWMGRAECQFWLYKTATWPLSERWGGDQDWQRATVQDFREMTEELFNAATSQYP